ncbi:MAG: hypothetical protein ACRDZR_04510 [Acidimicrobiales bacterium]
MVRSVKVGRIDDPVWLEEPDATSPRHAPWWKVVAVLVALAGIPSLTVWIRGICWESAVIAAVVLLPVLLLLRVGASAAVLTMVVLLVPSAVLLVGWSRLDVHTFNVFGPPSRITYCGRAYDQGSVVGRSALGGIPVHDVGVTPSGSAVLASGCDRTGIWVQISDTAYVGYGLQGGP